MKYYIALLTLLSLLMFSSCQQAYVETPKEYLEFIVNHSESLTKSRTIKGIKMVAKFMPATLLVLMDHDDITELQFRESHKKYEGSVTFILNISSAKDRSSNIMYEGVFNAEEYKKKSLEMNFFLKDNFQLKCGDQTISPLVVELENTYDLTNDRNLYIVFDRKQIDTFDEEKLSLVYEDQLFQTGVNFFNFNRTELFNNLPEIDWKSNSTENNNQIAINSNQK